MKHVIAKKVELTEDGYLVIDGLRLPWYIGEDVEIEDMGGGFLYALHVPILTDRVILNSNTGRMDTLMEEARQEALAIVRAGLADVIEQVERGGRS